MSLTSVIRTCDKMVENDTHTTLTITYARIFDETQSVTYSLVNQQANTAFELRSDHHGGTETHPDAYSRRSITTRRPSTSDQDPISSFEDMPQGRGSNMVGESADHLGDGNAPAIEFDRGRPYLA